ncbi:MAG: thiol-disulfide oxidoreductase DCC family protein [Acidobacteriota bacterium]
MAAVVLFDGVCNFCDASVNFVIEHDRNGYFKFAPLQSEVGKSLSKEYELAPAINEPPKKTGHVPIDSVILIEDGTAYTHSSAALRIARRLGRPWSWFYALIVVPAPIRDFFYRLFAKYRYRVFGRKDQCMLPSPEVRARFL